MEDVPGGGKGPMIQNELSGTLATNNDQTLFYLESKEEPVGFDGYNQVLTGTVAQTIRAEKSDADHVGMVLIPRQEVCAGFNGHKSITGSIQYAEETAPTLESNMPSNVVVSVHQNADGEVRIGGVANTLNTNGNASGRNAPLVMAHGQANAEILQNQSPTLNCNHEQPIVAFQNTVRVNQAVRRLTPLECERLQGYPDGWTCIGEWDGSKGEHPQWMWDTKYRTWIDSKGKKHPTSDSARYRALGNSIALPPWKWILKRIAACYERDATMGSLFDGIGGFPLLWEQINGPRSCRWASEVEEFCIAVTKKRFGG